MADGSDKPRVLILGGTGFIGRNFVQYLVTNDLISKVRVADKVPPQMAWMNPLHSAAFEDSRVEFKHANLINPTSVENAYASEDGVSFDYVVNFAAETKYGQSEPVYHEGIVHLSENCAQTAARCNVKMYVEISSGQMVSSEKKPYKEDAKCEPWTNMARHKLKVERSLAAIEGLNYAVVRPAIVYGPGDRQGLAPRVLVGSIYRYTKEKMKVLWTGDVRMNTVHVEDMCRLVWFVLYERQRQEREKDGESGGTAATGEIYHVVDKGSTTQGKICELVSQLFDIEYDFMGSVLSNLAKVSMKSVVEDINDKHMVPWADACQTDGIVNTPLTPVIDQELLYHKHLHMDGSKVDALGFLYLHPHLTLSALTQMVDDYIQMGLFPKCLLSDHTHYQPPQSSSHLSANLPHLEQHDDDDDDDEDDDGEEKIGDVLGDGMGDGNARVNSDHSQNDEEDHRSH